MRLVLALVEYLRLVAPVHWRIPSRTLITYSNC